MTQPIDPTQPRRESDRFTDKANATDRTLRALANVGFRVEFDTSIIDGTKVGTYAHSPTDNPDNVPEIAAVYTDPDTGNKITMGIDINGHDIKYGPYDWAAKTSRQTDGTELAGGGNHDNNQPEMMAQLTILLAAAHFNKPTGTVPTWTPEYREWEEGIQAQLAPIYYDTAQQQA